MPKKFQSLDAAAARFTNVQKLPAEEGEGKKLRQSNNERPARRKVRFDTSWLV